MGMVDVGVSDQGLAQSGASSPVSLGGDMNFPNKSGGSKELIIVAVVALVIVSLVFSKGR